MTWVSRNLRTIFSVRCFLQNNTKYYVFLDVHPRKNVMFQEVRTNYKFQVEFVWMYGNSNHHPSISTLRQLVGFRHGKKTFCQNSDKFCCSFIQNGIIFRCLLYIYRKPIILSLFKIDILNFTVYILANLTWPLKTYVRLHNLISMNISFTIKDHNFSLQFQRESRKKKQITKTFQKLRLLSVQFQRTFSSQ